MHDVLVQTEALRLWRHACERLAVLDCRASFAMYKTRAEVDILARALLKVREFFT